MMPYASTHDPGTKPSLAAIKDARIRSGRWKAFWIKRWNPKTPLSQPQLLAIKRALARVTQLAACGLRWPKSEKGINCLRCRHQAECSTATVSCSWGTRTNRSKWGEGSSCSEIATVRNGETRVMAPCLTPMPVLMPTTLSGSNSDLASLKRARSASREGMPSLSAGRYGLLSAAVSKDRASKPFYPWAGYDTYYFAFKNLPRPL